MADQIPFIQRLTRARWNALIVAVLFLGASWIATTRVQPTRATDLRPAPAGAAQPAPSLTLPALDGSNVALDDLRGQVVLINVWATWCPPCRAEMPALQTAYDHYRDEGFVVLAVNQREDAARVESFMGQYGLTFPALLDRDGVVAQQYGAPYLPASFFVDRAGQIRTTYRGPIPPRVVSGTIEQLLAEAP
jgi:cytochrome c biogenesis protein CcmG, thiol:disulfide interchange protein DsbE